MRKLPLDPWKREFVYTTTEDGKNFVLETLGKDGKPGGSADNGDIRATGDPEAEEE